MSLKLKRSFILMIDEKAFADFTITGFSYFRFVVLFIQNVHDEEIT